ncbi:hypothetical protein [Bacillus cereus]
MNRILSLELTPSASTYESWWGNDKTHVQANAWMDARWSAKAS